MDEKRYIAFDCEMGGLDLSNSLLTAYFAVTNEKFEMIDELYIRLKYDQYVVTAEGMAVNRIDLPSHDAVAEYKSTAGQKFRQFLMLWSNNGANKLTPVGHNAFGDLRFIYQYLLGKPTFDQFCDYHLLDTSVIYQYLQACNILSKGSASLENLAKYFEIEPVGALHDARTDALLTIEILKRFIGFRLVPDERNLVV
jgi:DNA polymerase III epsilon subunit-like protein